MIDVKAFCWKIVETIALPIRQEKTFFSYALLCTLAVLLVNNLHPLVPSTNVFLALLLPIMDCYLFATLAYGLRQIRLQWILYILFTILSLGEIFCLFCYHSLYSINVIRVVMETNAEESKEFVLSTLQTTSPWFAFGIIAACALLANVLVRYSKQWSHLVKQIALVVMCLLVLWSATREIKQYMRIMLCFSEHSTANLGDNQHLPSLRSSLVRMTYGIAFNYVSSQELNGMAKSQVINKVEQCSFRCPTILLVIGESYNKHHTPLYNPASLPTTPYLCQLRDNQRLIVVQDAVSPSNLTSNVMHQIFSTWDSNSADAYTDHLLFPIVFRQAGYKVVFISNQFVVNASDIWNMIGGTILNHPMLSAMQFDYRNSQCYAYDMDVLREIPPVDSLLAQPTLLIVHLMGQHVEYKERYPKAENLFHAEDMTTPFGGAHGKQLSAEYANALHYNDKVIAALWKRFEGQDVIGIYLSDHGEEVYDWRDFYERSDMDEMNPEIAHNQYEIPMMFLLTDTFCAHHQELVQTIQQQASLPFYSSDLSQVLFYLAGISTSEYQASRNILSHEYDRSRPRLIGNDMNYDQLMHKE